MSGFGRDGTAGHTLACLGLALLLGACATYQPGPRAGLGAAAGAAAGGLIASAAGDGAGDAIAAGVLMGGLLGGALGDALDQADRRYAAQGFHPDLQFERSETRRTWNPPRSIRWGPVTPVRRPYRTAYAYCREYSQVVVIEGRTRRVFGTACRTRRGEWRIVD